MLLSPQLVHRYLSALGVSRRQPSFSALRELVTAHLTHIPFENVSKLYNRKHHGLNGLPSLDLYLDGIERYHFGGTCYSNNFHFYTLLTNLGYEVKLCAADMRTPGVHAVILAAVDGREYLIDAGFAAPLLEPLPRDLTSDYVIALGRDRFVLKPQDATGCSRLELFRDGQFRHTYVVKPEPRKIADFSDVIAASFRPDATFLNCLLLTRFSPGRAVMIHNLTMVDSVADECTVQRFSSHNELIRKIEERFEMPKSILAEAVNELGELQDAWT